MAVALAAEVEAPMAAVHMQWKEQERKQDMTPADMKAEKEIECERGKTTRPKMKITFVSTVGTVSVAGVLCMEGRMGRGKSEEQSRNDLVNRIQKGHVFITTRRWPRQCQQGRRQQQGKGPYARWTSTDEGGDGAIAGGEDMINEGEGEDGNGAVAGGEDTTDDGGHGDNDGRTTQG